MSVKGVLEVLSVGALVFLVAMGANAADAPVKAEVGEAISVDDALELLGAAGPEALLKRARELEDAAELKDDEAAGLLQLAEAAQAEANALKSRADALRNVHAAAYTVLPPRGAEWKRHVIDNSLRKSEGARLGDVNGDGLPDVATAWENQEVVRIYVNPGAEAVHDPWPAVTLAGTPSVEDALLVDLDGDGALDVVSSLERGAERLVVNWGPSSEEFFHAEAWAQADFPQLRGVSQWMFATPIRLTPDSPQALVAGGKNYKADASAVLGILTPPADNPRDLSRWQWHELAKVSWVMSIEVHDINRDGYDDILFTDKHGPLAGVHWLANPGDGSVSNPWARAALTGPNVRSANFLTIADLDQDGVEDILASVELQREPGSPNHAHRRVLFLKQLDTGGSSWETHEILVPPGIGQSKGIAVGDIDLDGRNDIVLSSTGAVGALAGTTWLRYRHAPTDAVWDVFNIAGAEGIKYDLVHLLDLDADGDLDVLANDEKENGVGLGVFWYENPTLPANKELAQHFTHD